jgi:hypothetical protein
MKLAFSRNAFVQFTGMSDVIFELAVTLGNLASVVAVGWGNLANRLSNPVHRQAR